MLSIAWPWVFILLPLPYLVHRWMPSATSTESALRVPFYDGIASVSRGRQLSRKNGRLMMMWVLWIVLLLSAARPQWIGDTSNIPVTGRDMILAVDISGSMKAQDMVDGGRAESRLQAVKRIASAFIERRTGDRVGLILFGTRAYLQTPLSFDLKTVDALLQEAVIGMAGEKTAIGDAVGLALKRLRKNYTHQEISNKVLILLTDGANTAGAIDPLQASQLARNDNLKIYTIGVGAAVIQTTGLFGQTLLRPGNELDEATLSDMASMTGGRYFRATDVQSLEEIYRLIDQLEPVEDGSRYLRPTVELFYLPLAIAAILAVLMSLAYTGLFATYSHEPMHLNTVAPQSK